jgi:catechol 2,3-dioxygenase
VLGFDEMQRYGDEAAFLAAGGYHHHVALNTWESKGGSPPGLGTTGLYHFAIRYPTRRGPRGCFAPLDRCRNFLGRSK